MSDGSRKDRRTLLVNAAANWAGFAVQVAVAFCLAPRLLHSLGDERYGVWSLVESILAYLLLFDLGIGASVVRRVAWFTTTRDCDSLNRVFSTSVSLFAVTGTAALLVCAGIASLIGCWNIPPDLVGEARWMLLLLGANLAAGLPLNVFASVLVGLEKYPAYTALRTACLVLRSGLMLVVIGNGGGLVALAAVITGCNVVEYAAVAVAAWCYVPGLRFSLALVDRQTFREIRGYSTDAFLAMLAGRVSFQTDAIVIGAFLGVGPIAFFTLANRLVDYAKNSLRAATTVVTPRVSALDASEDRAAIRRILFDATRWVLWLVAPVEVGLLVLGRPFLTLWIGPEHAVRSYPTLVILSLPLVLVVTQSVASRIFFGVGQIRWYTRLVLIEAAVNLLLSIALAGPLGIEGVALGTTIPNVVVAVLTAARACRTVGVSRLEYLCRAFLPPALLAIVPAAVWLGMANWWPVTSWTAFCLVGAAGMAVYLPLVALTELRPTLGLRREPSPNAETAIPDFVAAGEQCTLRE